MPDESLSLLNIYEIEDEEAGGTRHLVGFLDPVRAGARGLASHAMVGEFTPGPDGEFDGDSFVPNPEFVAAVTAYMNAQAGPSPEVAAEARKVPGDWLYLVDPRDETPDGDDPPRENILGAFAVDEGGQVVPNSFQYNANHRWFSRESGVSGMLEDRRFYDWLHAQG